MKTRLVVLSAVMLMCGACEHLPGATAPIVRTPCPPPVELASQVRGAPFAPVAMRSALSHAAATMTRPFGSGSDVLAMRDSINAVSTHITAVDYNAACIALRASYSRLVALPVIAPTLPDRDGIRLILALTAQSLVAVMGSL